MTGQGHAVPGIENIRDAIQEANERNSSGPHEGIVPFLVNEIDEALLPDLAPLISG